MAKRTYKNLQELRSSCSLSTTQLAYRLGTSQSSVVRLEQSEERGSISIASLRRAAAALGSELRYELVPIGDLPEGKQTSGLKRVGASKKRKNSQVNQALREDERRLISGMSIAEKITRACELADISHKFAKCSK